MCSSNSIHGCWFNRKHLSKDCTAPLETIAASFGESFGKEKHISPCAHACMHPNIHACVNTHKQLYIHMPVHASIKINTYAYNVYVCISICLGTSMCMCACKYIYIYLFVYGEISRFSFWDVPICMYLWISMYIPNWEKCSNVSSKGHKHPRAAHWCCKRSASRFQTRCSMQGGNEPLSRGNIHGLVKSDVQAQRWSTFLAGTVYPQPVRMSSREFHGYRVWLLYQCDPFKLKKTTSTLRHTFVLTQKDCRTVGYTPGVKEGIYSQIVGENNPCYSKPAFPL